MRRTSRRRLLATSAWMTLGGWAAGERQAAMAQPPLVTVRTGIFGDLLEASYAGPQGIVRAIITKEATGATVQATIEILQGDASLVTVTAHTPMQTVPLTLGSASFALRAGAARYRLRWDAGAIAVNAREFPSDGSALVEVRSGAQVWRGLFDLRTWSMRSPWEAPDADAAVPPAVVDLADPFAAVFQSLVVHDQGLSGGAFAPTPGVRPVLQAGTANVACSAACWGAAGGAVAAARVGAPGIICILAEGACSTAASVCHAMCRS